MKRLIWIWFFACFLVPAIGQHRGGFGGGFGRGSAGRYAPGSNGRFHGGVVIGGFPSQAFANVGLPPVGPIPPLGSNASFATFDQRLGFSRQAFQSTGFEPNTFPLLAGGYDYEHAPAPNIVVVQQPMPQMFVQPAPREIVRSEIHDYKGQVWPIPPAVKGEPILLAVVLKDGTVRSAIAVWVQDNVLHYIDIEDRHYQVPMESIDRPSTRKLNRERNLDLWLPAPRGE